MDLRKVLCTSRSYIVTLLLALVVAVWTLVLGSRPVSPSDDTPVRVVIPKGASATEIAEILSREKVIRSPFVFLITCRISGKTGSLMPGVYAFTRAMSVPEIVRALVRADSLEAWVTIPEGYTIRQIADTLQRASVADADEFARVALTQGYDFPEYPFIYSSSLEGYLFPDTYLISRESKPEAIIDKMLEAFERKVLLNYRLQIEEAASRCLGIESGRFFEGLHKLLTVASLVEREARVAKDRPLIAAVIYNRLKRGMKLEIDATVTYVPGDSRENKSRVLYEDLKTESPYNTYLHAGLPPGPICNPGLASIKAALQPANADYLYYVAKPDGSHIFSQTLQEHNRAKRAISGR
ncbi:MAG: endolytic transglycosylase MltG [Armatimonadota bacterium]